jgi:hypothetical protein
MRSDWKKYAIAFVITAAIFSTAIFVSSSLNDRRVDEIRNIQDSIAINILSSETQFNLLREASCDDLFSSALAEELGRLADRLSYMASVGRGVDPEVMTLKKYYSLLQIKDYLLSVSASAKCPDRPVAILYFYGRDCPDCRRQGEVLTYIRQHNPEDIRVYSFDYALDLSAIRTLANVNKISEPFPALVIKGRAYNGFRSIEDLEALIPEIVPEESATSTTATTTSN